MLRRLGIQNFKGIREGALADLAQVNLLVGRNNSGKSTVLDALIMLRCPFVKQDYLYNDGLEQITKRRVDRQNINRDELWHRMDTDVPLILSAEFAGGEELTEEWSPNLTAIIRSQRQEWRFPPDYTSTAKNFPDRGQWAGFIEVVGEAQARRIALAHLLDADSIHVPYAERLWPELVKDRRDDKVRRILNEVYHTDIEYLAFMPFPQQQRLVAALPHAGVAVDWLGDGFRYAVNILAFGVLLQGTSLLIEELETHQHPESLRMLTQALFRLAKQQDLQLFITTHSAELISYAVDTAGEQGIDLKLHHLVLNREGTLESTPLSLPNAKLLLDIGHDPRLHYKYTGVE